MKDLTDEEIEKYCKSIGLYKWTIDRCISAAKFARDHSPKFKTLDDIKWWLDHQNMRESCYYVDTAFGIYYAQWGGTSWWMGLDGIKHKAKDMKDAMQLAQSDYD